MRIISKNFWDAVLIKLVETAISIKIWILAVIIYFVNRLYCVADEIREFMMLPAISEVQKMKILSAFQGKIYDIATSLIITGIVVIVLSRVSFQHAKLKNGHKYELTEAEKESAESIKNEFA